MALGMASQGWILAATDATLKREDILNETRLCRHDFCIIMQ